MLEFLLNTQVFLSEICEILKSTFFEEYLQTTASRKALTANYCFITTQFFLIQEIVSYSQTEVVENGGAKVTGTFLRIITFFSKI